MSAGGGSPTVDRELRPAYNFALVTLQKLASYSCNVVDGMTNKLSQSTGWTKRQRHKLGRAIAYIFMVINGGSDGRW
jgi:hypothetical protein